VKVVITLLKKQTAKIYAVVQRAKAKWMPRKPK